jgi:fimbrial chaperone protein
MALRKAVWLWAGLGLCGWAGAQSFSLTPTAFNINPERTNTAQVRLQNQTLQPLQFRVEVMKWSMDGGQAAYVPTRDVVVNPPTFQLGPQGAQVIRVGVLKKAGADEMTYRVFVRQVSDTATAQVDQQDAQINLSRLINISLPVYVTPPNSAAKVSFRMNIGGQTPALEVTNSGNRHLTLRQLRLVSGDQTFPLGSNAVLGRSTLALALPPTLPAAAAVEVRYQDAEDKEQRAAVAR